MIELPEPPHLAPPDERVRGRVILGNGGEPAGATHGEERFWLRTPVAASGS